MTKQNIKKILDEGAYQYTKFFHAAKAFLIRATEYLIKWCPLDDELMTRATWIDFKRLDKTFLSVRYFVERYSEIIIS